MKQPEPYVGVVTLVANEGCLTTFTLPTDEIRPSHPWEEFSKTQATIIIPYSLAVELGFAKEEKNDGIQSRDMAISSSGESSL